MQEGCHGLVESSFPLPPVLGGAQAEIFLLPCWRRKRQNPPKAPEPGTEREKMFPVPTTGVCK